LGQIVKISAQTQPAPPLSPPTLGTIALPIDGIVIGAAITMATAAWGLIRWFATRSVTHTDRQFEETKRELSEIRKELGDIRADSQTLRNEVGANYVRRDDWVGFDATVNAKMDGLHRRFDQVFAMLMESKK